MFLIRSKPGTYTIIAISDQYTPIQRESLEYTVYVMGTEPVEGLRYLPPCKEIDVVAPGTKAKYAPDAVYTKAYYVNGVYYGCIADIATAYDTITGEHPAHDMNDLPNGEEIEPVYTVRFANGNKIEFNVDHIVNQEDADYCRRHNVGDTNKILVTYADNHTEYLSYYVKEIDCMETGEYQEVLVDIYKLAYIAGCGSNVSAPFYGSDRKELIYVSLMHEINGATITVHFIEGLGKSAVKTVLGTADAVIHAKRTCKGIAFLANAVRPYVMGTLPTPESLQLIEIIKTTFEEQKKEFEESDWNNRAEMLGEYTGDLIQFLLVAGDIAAALKDLKYVSQSGKLSKMMSEVSKGTRTIESVASTVKLTGAMVKIKSAIKASYDELGKLIKRFYSKIGNEVEVEYADVGRLKFQESEVIEGADLIAQQRYKNFLEAKWIESEGSLIDDAAEALMNGQQYTKNGRIKVLKSDISYVSNGYSYKTDSLGRITITEGKLVGKEASRNSYAQRMAGRIDRLTTDDGGHLIGSQFNGSGNIDNLVPMNSQINRSGGKWYKMEQEWKAALDSGKQVNVIIEPVYSGVSQRPYEFRIRYKIGTDDWEKIIITNQTGG